MTTEEKAKAYEMALEAARKELGVDRKEWEVVQRVLHNIFPELRESEDERIGNVIYCIVRDNKEVKRILDGNGVSVDNALAYLEKQKERGPLTKEEEYILYRIIEFLEDETCPSEWISLLHDIYYLPYEKQKEQETAEWSEDYREEDIQTRFAFYTYKDDPSVLYLSNVFVEESSRNHGFGTRILKAAEKVAETIGAITISLKVKQNSPANAWYRQNGYGYVAFEDGYDWLEKNLEYMKPQPKQEWSEEDTEMYINVASSLRGYACGLENEEHKKHIQKGLDWLENRFKSLRPDSYKNCNSRWSEEDKEHIESLLKRLDGMCKKGATFTQTRFAVSEDIDWLKSLRPSWKPSEEQMEALSTINCHGDLSYIGQQSQLISLYNDLKKLM